MAGKEGTPRQNILDKNHLAFEFDINHVQFNHQGRFFLRLSVCSSFSTKDYSKIKVQKNKVKNYVTSRQVNTDTITQAELKTDAKFKDHKWTFFLPKGFCKNDKNHDVYLNLAAFSVDEGEEDSEGKKVGEAQFAIYPRTNHPKVNIYADVEENMFRKEDVISLFRTASTDNVKMHCGRLKYTASFRKIRKMPQNADSTPTPTPRESSPTPTPSPSVREPSPSLRPAPSPTPPTGLPDRLDLPSTPEEDTDYGTRIAESPLPSDDQRTARPGYGAAHVARPSKDEIVVLFHGAANLPSLPDGKAPKAYCTLKSLGDEELARRAQGKTHATRQKTHMPVWEEVLTLDIDENNTAQDEAILTIADGGSKKTLASYRLPVRYLKPFHQYHLEMVRPTKHAKNGVRLFATIMRKSNSLPLDPSSPNYVGLEVLLRGVQQRVTNPMGNLIAVARVVPDYYVYKTEMLQHSAGSPSVPLTTVLFPHPDQTAFQVPRQRSEGYPQVSLPGKPQEQPEWNHPYLFHHSRDKATLFTPGAALVFEFYKDTQAMSHTSWRLQEPVGFSAVLLDQDVYRQMVALDSTLGVRVEGLPIQGTSLTTKYGEAPTIGLVLRIVESERPDILTSLSDYSVLPEMKLLDINPDKLRKPRKMVQPESDEDDEVLSLPQPASPRRQGYMMLHRKLKKPLGPIKDGELPPMDAMDSILPEYQYIFVDPDGKKRAPPADAKPPEATDKATTYLVDYQLRELEKYRLAVHKMGQDILTLRQQIRELESVNGNLRREIANYNDATKMLLDSQELDGLTKPELAARYVAMKQKVSGQSADLRDYKDRVHKLQNELIRKNDQEKEYLKMSNAHASQNELLQKLQEKQNKQKRLEDTVKKQEKVIEKLERRLTQPDQRQEAYSNVANDAMMEENTRLRQEIEKLKVKSPIEDREKLELYEKLDKSEGRIISLEAQLASNARLWGKEKSELAVKLQEAEHGLRRSPLAYDYNPKLSSSSPVGLMSDGPRKYSKAPPRKSKYSPKLAPISY